MTHKTSKIIFTISILLNLVFLGFVGSHEYKKSQHHNFTNNIHEKSKGIIRQNLDISEDERRQKMKEVQQKRQALKDIVTAPEFDLVQYNKITEELLAQKDQMERKKAAALGQAMVDLSQEERQELSTHLLSKKGNKKERYKDRNGQRPPRHETKD